MWRKRTLVGRIMAYYMPGREDENESKKGGAT